MKIHLLPDVVANQIAAGEVVGRPASVVKEMTENAVDAGATVVSVNFRGNGNELIQVVDNGDGMTAADARMAFEKHATSKINSLDDIYALHTFGFRGEALASIAAVAEVELLTRTTDDELGTRVVIRGGEFGSQEPAVAPKGSNFMVRNLFYNVPARRKFLENSTAETNNIISEFRRVALCHPEVALLLYKDDAPLFNLPAANLRSRIVAMQGKGSAANLLDVDTHTTIVTIEGYVGRPDSAKKRGGDQFLFVNGRFFKNAYLHKAIVSAYEKLIPAGTLPAYYIYLTVDPDKIDVNVHPQKTEVKFTDQQAVWQILNAAVRESLAKTGVVPMMDFDPEIEIPVFDAQKVAERGFDEPSSTINPYYNPFTASSHGRRSEASLNDFSEVYNPLPDNNLERFDDSELEFIEGGERMVEMDLEFERDRFSGAIPLAEGYAATSIGGRLAVIDLARAREVILYKRFLTMLRSGNSASQQLLFPERAVFSHDDVVMLDECRDRFTSIGFDYEILDDNTVEVSAVPSDVALGALGETLCDLIDTLRDGGELTEEARHERMAAVLSHTTTAKKLTQGELEAVIDALEGCHDCSLTPDGRAVVHILQPSEINSYFK